MIPLSKTTTLVARLGATPHMHCPKLVSASTLHHVKHRCFAPRSCRALLSTPSFSAKPSPEPDKKASALPNQKQMQQQPDASTATSSQMKKKTQTEMDEELRLKMEGLSGDGGASGVEYEDGKAVAMKRSVKENMFRYI